MVLGRFGSALERFIGNVKQVTLPGGSAISSQPEEKDKLIGQLAFELATWHFKYLDLFLVPATKFVLMWFFAQKHVERDTYEKAWGSLVSEEQLRIMLSVLLDNQLLENKNGLFRVTFKGSLFLQYIGLLPFKSESQAS